MPKKKSQRNSRAVIQVPAKSVKPWVRWSAIIVIFALVFSIMLAAMTSAPASAVSPSASPTVCTPIDTDGDGIQNNNDSDIDGDGLVNGMDEDIDGDGVANGEDNDATSTNCEQSTTPPTLNEEFNIDGTKKSPEFAWQWVVGILAIGFGYLTLRQVRRRK